jgi:hypothetical protein
MRSQRNGRCILPEPVQLTSKYISEFIDLLSHYPKYHKPLRFHNREQKLIFCDLVLWFLSISLHYLIQWQRWTKNHAADH